MAKSIFITGNSSGLGHALSACYLTQGAEVYGLSRRGATLTHPRLHDIQCDLADLTQIQPALASLLADCKKIDVVYLNAGLLGQLQAINDTHIEQLNELMRVNLWCNKLILDWLLQNNIQCPLIIGISSGAAISGSRGWSGYALSKAALNMLLKLYAHEWPGSQLIALAPGLINTRMQDYLQDNTAVSVEDFPTLQRLRDAHGTSAMQSIEQAADRIIQLTDKLKQIESGSFIDIREFTH